MAAPIAFPKTATKSASGVGQPYHVLSGGRRGGNNIQFYRKAMQRK